MLRCISDQGVGSGISRRRPPISIITGPTEERPLREELMRDACFMAGDECFMAGEERFVAGDECFMAGVSYGGREERLELGEIRSTSDLNRLYRNDVCNRRTIAPDERSAVELSEYRRFLWKFESGKQMNDRRYRATISIDLHVGG
mmetsp:Transcript_27603/g.63266  ORF Transcript_27603/g.63266 Transcript_27603/m.63266 type:complete len:146 (+) Transcript_27603:125-562(+)